MRLEDRLGLVLREHIERSGPDERGLEQPREGDRVSLRYAHGVYWYDCDPGERTLGESRRGTAHEENE